MNDGFKSEAGLTPQAFPNKPVYTGHYHKPHTVTGFPNIMYIGSPYQTGLAESGQMKRLLLLENNSWSIVDEIPLDIGKRFHKYRGMDFVNHLNDLRSEVQVEIYMLLPASFISPLVWR